MVSCKSQCSEVDASPLRAASSSGAQNLLQELVQVQVIPFSGGRGGLLALVPPHDLSQKPVQAQVMALPSEFWIQC